MKKIELKEHEKILDLQCRGLYIIQSSEGYRFTMDAVLLANFARAKYGDKVADLGTGSGIIPILMSGKCNAKKFVAIEYQSRLADMARRSVEYNSLENRIEIVNCDMRDAADRFGRGCFDVITVNPPYMPYKGNVEDATENDVAKREVIITLKEVVRTAGELLKYGGLFFIVLKGDRLPELFEYMKNADIAPKRLVAVQPKVKKNVDTILVEGKKSGSAGMVFEKPLVVFNEDGTYTQALKRIYNEK